MARATKTQPSTASPKPQRSVREVLREPTTWAGLLSIGAAIATGGASALLDPSLCAQVGAGLALILAREG